MNSMKALTVIAALTLSSLAMAEGGGDRTFARMQLQEAVSTQVAQQQKAATPMADTQMEKAEQAPC